MIKEETVTTESIVKKVYCDFCKKEVIRKPHYPIPKCTMCEKDMCHDCVGVDMEYGDTVIYHCKRCWSIGRLYRHKIKVLESKIDDLEIEYKNYCLLSQDAMCEDISHMNIHERREREKKLIHICPDCNTEIVGWSSDDIPNTYLNCKCLECNEHKRFYYWP